MGSVILWFTNVTTLCFTFSGHFQTNAFIKMLIVWSYVILMEEPDIIDFKCLKEPEYVTMTRFILKKKMKLSSTGYKKYLIFLKYVYLVACFNFKFICGSAIRTFTASFSWIQRTNWVAGREVGGGIVQIGDGQEQGHLLGWAPGVVCKR